MIHNAVHFPFSFKEKGIVFSEGLVRSTLLLTIMAVIYAVLLVVACLL